MKNIRKNIVLGLLLLLVGLLIACLCACNTKDDNSGNNQGGNNETPTHTHTLSLVSAKSADCVNSGNSAYYTCTCGKWFTDSNATTEITDKSSVVISALGHKYSTEWSQSKTQHWHECSVCGKKKDTANHIDTADTCICGYKKPVETVKITAIYLDKSMLSIYIGNSATLNATLIPSNATEEITWVSTNTAVATVNNGVINGIGAGTTTIIASSPSGIVANCAVLVSEDTHGFSFREYGNGYAVTAYTGTDTTVTVPDSYNNKPVIAIGTGYDGFGSCTNLIEVVLPDSIYEINGQAFNNCSNLKKINIPNTVTTIGAMAFNGCSSLKNLIIPDSVVSFGYYAFEGCVNIENLTAPSYILSQIPTGNLKTVRITSGTTIGNAAFKNCTRLQEITLCDTITEIGDEAFSGCSSLTSITIPDSVTTVGGGLFYNCSSLESVSLSNKIVSLSYYRLNYSEKFGFFEGCINLKNVEIPNGVKTIDYYTFTNCSSLTDITVPESVIEIAEGAFYGCNSLESITLPFVGKSKSDKLEQGIEYVFGYIFGSVYTSGDDPVEGATFQLAEKQGSIIKNYFCFIPASLQKVSLIGNSKYINYCAFNNCKNLKKIMLSDSITKIGESAFKNCSWLTNVSIGNGVTSISGSAFYGCSGLTSITIPFVGDAKYPSYEHFGYIFGAPSVSSNYAYVPKSLKTVIISGGTAISESAFSGCSGLTNVIIPDTVTKIQENAFENCSGLTSITIPDSVTSIGNSAFSGCSSLTNITIPDSVTSIGSSAFSGCSSLTNITIPDSITSISSGTFDGCSSLTSITIPSNVTSIHWSAFGNCSSLTDLDVDVNNTTYFSEGNCIFEIGSKTLFLGCKNSIIPEWVTSIGMYAFYHCTGLTKFIIPSGIISIGYYAFMKCSDLTSITIPESVKYIDDCAFSGCSSLKSVTLNGANLSSINYLSIGNSAFTDCSSLETIYFIGWISDFYNDIYFGNNNQNFTSATVYSYSETEPTDDGNYWHYDTDGVTPIVWGKDN